MKFLTILGIAYLIGKMTMFLAMILPYYRWKTWRAKSIFENELRRNGVPRELASNLANTYNDGNKGLLVSFLRPKAPESAKRSAVISPELDVPME